MTIQEELRNDGLTERELEVVEHVIQGKSNDEVGAALFVVNKTVRFHLTNIFRKLGVKNRQQLSYNVLRRNKPFKIVNETIVFKTDTVLPGSAL